MASQFHHIVSSIYLLVGEVSVQEMLMGLEKATTQYYLMVHTSKQIFPRINYVVEKTNKMSQPPTFSG